MNASSPFHWTDASVRAALDLPRASGEDDRIVFRGVSTDTRSIQPGDLFVALVGERFDAHDFLAQAREAGAAGIVVSRDVEDMAGVAVYRVRDTLLALGDLARFRRRSLAVPVVGVTGSAGKTTTKELIRAVLAPRYRVHATRGNLNNRIGVPLTILAAPDDTEVLVLEMGTNEPGEIAALTAIAEPDIGVVSTVAQAHLEKLGSLEGIFTEKLALLEGLPPKGLAVVGDRPADLPPRARAKTDRVRVAGWSPLADDDLRPRTPESDEAGRYSFSWLGERVRLSIPGRHAVLAALLALAVALELGVAVPAAAAAVSTVEPAPLRGEVLQVGRLTVVADCYNANPASVRASLSLLAELPATRRRVAILGSMLELGDQESALHYEVLREALNLPLDLVVATGLFVPAAGASGAPEDGRLAAVEDPLEAYQAVRPLLRGDEVVLLKGSRGTAMERLIPLFQRDFGAAAGSGPEGGSA